MSDSSNNIIRRSMLARLGVGVAAVGAIAAGPASAQSNSAPTRHREDDWLDRGTAAHRLVIDSTTPAGGGAALAYASNFLVANKNGYRLDPPSLAVVVVYRHFATPVAYNDAIWAKYGSLLSAPTNFTDPKTKQPPKMNVFNATGYGLTLTNFGATIDSLAKQGVQFAVCDMATHFFAGQIAEQTKGNADAVYRELTGNLIPNAHMAAAGIVAVNRAQERGYTFAYAA